MLYRFTGMSTHTVIGLPTHFTDEETDPHKASMIWPTMHSWWAVTRIQLRSIIFSYFRLNNPYLVEERNKERNELNQSYKCQVSFKGIFFSSSVFVFLKSGWLISHAASPCPQVFWPRTELTLCNGHDSREGGHDEVLRLLGIVVGQAVDIRQGADRGQTSSWDWDLLERKKQEQHE